MGLHAGGMNVAHPDGLRELAIFAGAGGGILGGHLRPMPHYKLSELSAPLRSRVEGLLPSAPKRRKARQGESPLVASLLRQIASAGLPAPVQEHRFHPIRKWRFDLAWPERMIAVEVDGGVWSGGRHTRGAGFVADCEKTNEATAMGWRVFRFPTPRVSDGTAIAMLRRVMA